MGACYGPGSVLDVQDVTKKARGGPGNVNLSPALKTVGLGDGRHMSPGSAAATHLQWGVMSKEPIPPRNNHPSPPLGAGMQDQGVHYTLPGPADLWLSGIRHLVYRLGGYKYPIQNKPYILLSSKYIPRRTGVFYLLSYKHQSLTLQVH